METEWHGAEPQALDVLRVVNSKDVLACIFDTSYRRMVRLWPGASSNGEVSLPWPEGMEMGDELRAYAEAQHKLLFGSE